MKKLMFIAAAAILSTGAAFAQDSAKSTAAAPLSREQVLKELTRARATGEMDAARSEDTAVFGTPLKSARKVVLADADIAAPAKDKAQ